jgi:hypothetical protein
MAGLTIDRLESHDGVVAGTVPATPNFEAQCCSNRVEAQRMAIGVAGTSPASTDRKVARSTAGGRVVQW